MWIKTHEDELINVQQICRMHIEVPISGSSYVVAELVNARSFLYKGTADECFEYLYRLENRLEMIYVHMSVDPGT